MPASKLKHYLNEHKITYLVIPHPRTYTAQETALSAYFSESEVAKTVVVRIDGAVAMIVLPASYKLDFDLLQEVTGARNIELIEEDELSRLFPDCEVGAMPPFGNLYFLDVFVAKNLADQDVIVFNAGNHRELIEMRYEDFARLVHPKVINLALEIF